MTDDAVEKQKSDRHRFRVAISLPEHLWIRLGKLVGDRNRSEVARKLFAWYLREPGAKLPERPPRQDASDVHEASSGS